MPPARTCRLRPARVLTTNMQGEPSCVAQAVYVVTAAVDRYKELCEGRYNGAGTTLKWSERLGAGPQATGCTGRAHVVGHPRRTAPDTWCASSCTQPQNFPLSCSSFYSVCLSPVRKNMCLGLCCCRVCSAARAKCAGETVRTPAWRCGRVCACSCACVCACWFAVWLATSRVPDDHPSCRL